MLKFDIVEAKSIWPGVKQLISHLLECKMDYIIEGVHLLPNLVKEFKSNRNIKIVFLTKYNEEKILSGIFKNKNNSDWILDNVKNKSTVRLAAKSMSTYGIYFLKETKNQNFKCINTEDNFRSQLNQAVHFLTN